MFLHKVFLHRKAHTHRFFIHRCFSTKQFLHRKVLTQRNLHTHTHTHADFFIQKPLCTEQFLHRKTFTQRSFYTETVTHWFFLHKETLTRGFFSRVFFYTQMLVRKKNLHTDVFSQPSHRGAFTHSSFYAYKVLCKEMISHFPWICHLSSSYLRFWCFFWSTPSCSSFGPHCCLVFISLGVLFVRVSSSFPFAAKQTEREPRHKQHIDRWDRNSD